MKKVIIIRYGHRIYRDSRMTTHIALISRALGANGMILTDIEDKALYETIQNINSRWGSMFYIEMGVNWKTIITQIKKNNDLLVHLTMYGLNLDKKIIKRIKNQDKNIYIFVGSQKVPSEIFNLADFNIAITNQPQSECGALAIFLDRIFERKTLNINFSNAKIRIIPTEHEKKVEKVQ
ncbi:MAG: tRNA (cytidine(56)-2'-O)-methyltransferase [Candidatus Helarchaeota archaeon]